MLLYSFVQLFTAMLLGGLLGVERSLAGKVAGMRTYGLVAMGSCLFIIVSEYVASVYFGSLEFDPLRMAAAIVTGIGFIGAGLIIFQEQKLSGLTTAAGLWVASGIGIAVGFGMFSIAFFASVLTLFNFTVLWSLEHKLKSVTRKDEK